MQNIKGLNWNSEGFGDTAKHLFIKETIREHKLDFLALLETGRSNFSVPFLNQLAAGFNFIWFCLPPHGRSGGILVGINSDTLQVLAVKSGDYCVKLHIKCKRDGFEWILVPVYGAAQETHKADFLAEIVRTCEHEPLPMLIGGDFNIIRKREEKNNNNFKAHWPFVFNAIIEHLDLREIALSGRQYTWANRRESPTFEKLDRVLASVAWEQKFPLVTVRALTRTGSDHAPILIDSGIKAHLGNRPRFSFELHWLRHDGFYDMIVREWQSVTTGSAPMDRWLNKLRHIRRFLKGWAKNLSGQYKKEKERLLSIIDELDLKAESIRLSEQERDALRTANDKMAKLRREEEAKWAQRAKVKHILEGGNNTRYFHLIANGKHRKKKIFQLEQQEGTIVGDDNLKVYISEFYKKLFGPPTQSNVSLSENFLQDIPQVSEVENELLTAPFTEKEVHDAIFQMELNKAPGPDGFPAEFFQTFWELIKGDLMPLFEQLGRGELPLYKLNFGVITLLPKKEDATQIQQYRPICLLNVCFKIFTKVGTNRIMGIAPKVIRPTQSAFIPGRNILEGVVILHETIHELHSKKLDGVLFKIDFEKAYDKVKWSFLQQTLRLKGFAPRWCELIYQFVQKGSVGVKVNDDIGHFFQTRKGLRQGDPLSPMLFNIVADMLAILIERAKGDGQVGCLIPHLVEGGISILQYADDTILFMEHDLQKAVNMKLILCLFEELSGLKINFHKSELFCFGKAKDEEHQYRQIFGCEVGVLPFRYLGIPIHYRKLRNSDWYPVETRFESKLGCWKGKLLSYGDRLVLINSVLTSLPMFMLSFLEIPVGVRKRLDFYRSRFFWQSDEHKRKYRLTKWNIICRPKDQGGLGIEVLELKNKCLLSKWLFQLLNEEGVWQELLRNKYLSQKTLAEVQAKPTDSAFWKGLMRVKDDFFARGSFIIGNGESVRFWEDIWIGNASLASQYPSLYNIVNRKHVTVAHVLGQTPINISFRRSLTGNKWTAWLHLCQRLMMVVLNHETDRFVWKLTTNGLFSVKSFYEDLMNEHTPYTRKYLWKMKIPLKIKIFMWFLSDKVLLTKDNLAKRQWTGCTSCVFCGEQETVEHLFIACPFAKLIWRTVTFTHDIPPPSNVDDMFGNWLNGVDKQSKDLIRIGVSALCWSIWRCRNDIIFNNKTKFDFLQVLFSMVHWIRLWALLSPQAHQDVMATGCIRLQTVVLDILCRAGWQHISRIQDV
jgi:exonuclease III